MTISSMLLIAVGTAFRASFNSYKDSQERGQLLNSSRSFMYQIISDIRNSDAAGPYDTVAGTKATENGQYVSLQVPGNPTAGLSGAGGSGITGIQLIKSHADSLDPTASVANPVTITYWFDAANQRVLCTRQTGATTPTPRTVCSFMQSLQIYMQPVYVPANPRTGAGASVALSRAVVTAVLANKDVNGNRLISDGSQYLTLTFCDSATPRKSLSGL